MDELVDCLAKPKYAQKLVVILAGYDEDMDRLMSINPGLTSRFPESVIFKHMDPETCFKLLTKTLETIQKKQKGTFDISVLSSPRSKEVKQKILALLGALSKSKSWGNGRDVKSLAKDMFGKLISSPVKPGASLVLTETIVIGCMEKMLAERNRRTEAAGTTRHGSQLGSFGTLQPQQLAPNLNAPKMDTTIATSTAAPIEKPEGPHCEEAMDIDMPDMPPGQDPDPQRDSSVSDAVWHQLNLDKQAAVARENEFQRLQQEKIQEEYRIAELKRREEAAAEAQERQRLEEERIRAELERRRRDEELAALERERQKEMEMLKKLKQMGVCCMGFEWIRQARGFRCAGGSHFLTNRQAGFE